LNKALTQLDTRTATEELRKIAIGAGQMGIAKEDVLKFTAAVDKMVVSLGDEFSGGAEEVTKVFGGLRNVFTDIKSDKVDQDLLHIGNAVNELAAAGIATGPVVTDFANRIGGVGIQLGLSSGQVLGLSATLQELNVSTERGGTAVSRILQKMTTHVGEFAQVANMDFKSFGELVNKDLYGAFIKVVEGAKKGGQSATSFGKILDDLGVDGAGASEVISKLGGNTALLKEKVDLASGALKGTSSILQEFSLKNNTLGADLDRLGKAMTTAFTGSALQNGLKNITRFLTDIFDKKKDFEKLAESWRTQKTLVENLSTSMSPLLKRHDELKEKTILTTDEQKELKSIVQKVSETLPIAVTEFNKYGDALDINTEKGRKFIEMEKSKLAILNRDAIKSYGDELLSVTKKIEGLQKTLNDPFTVSSSNQAIGGVLFSEGEKGSNDKNRNRQQLTNEQLKEIRTNLKLAQEQQKGLVLVLNELKGVSIDAPKSTTSKSRENSPAVVDEELQKKLVAQQKKALEEKQKAYEKFLSDVEALEFKNSERYLSDQQREVNEVYKKYRVLLAAAKTGSEEEKVILQAQKDELEDIDKKYYDKALKAKEEYQQKRRTLENSDEQNEIDRFRTQSSSSFGRGGGGICEEATQEIKLVSAGLSDVDSSTDTFL
jgi:TP901 family phage tail tape measure protein